MAKNDDIKNKITYVGFIINPSESNSFILDELMRKFQSAKRFSRERIFEGLDRKETVLKTKELFINNSRYMRDAFLEARSNIESQKELLPIYIEELKETILEIEKKIEKISKSNKKNKLDLIEYKKIRIKKLTKLINYYEYHIKNKTVPKTVDGTSKMLKLLNKGKVTKNEWRDIRTNSIYSRGEKSKNGNENTKLTYSEDNLFILRILNPLSNKKGDRLEFKVSFPNKQVLKILNYLKTGEAYSIRIIRVNGLYQVHFTMEMELVFNNGFSNGVAGIDINVDNISVSICYENGNFKKSKVFWMSDINSVRSNKRDFIIGITVKEAIRWIKDNGVNVISIEELTFRKKHSKKSSYNRMIHNFTYRKIANTILTRCFKEKVSVYEVQAYYSSLIGMIKYKKMLGLSNHQAAAYVLARRLLGFKEKVNKETMLVLFTKEAKEGQILYDLFDTWAKVKEWLDNLKANLLKEKIKFKNWFIDDFIKYHYKIS